MAIQFVNPNRRVMLFAAGICQPQSRYMLYYAVGKNRYAQTPIRFHERDQECIAKTQERDQCESTTQAVRFAFYELTNGTKRPMKYIYGLFVEAC